MLRLRLLFMQFTIHYNLPNKKCNEDRNKKHSHRKHFHNISLLTEYLVIMLVIIIV